MNSKGIDVKPSKTTDLKPHETTDVKPSDAFHLEPDKIIDGMHFKLYSAQPPIIVESIHWVSKEEGQMRIETFLSNKQCLESSRIESSLSNNESSAKTAPFRAYFVTFGFNPSIRAHCLSRLQSSGVTVISGDSFEEIDASLDQDYCPDNQRYYKRMFGAWIKLKLESEGHVNPEIHFDYKIPMEND